MRDIQMEPPSGKEENNTARNTHPCKNEGELQSEDTKDDVSLPNSTKVSVSPSQSPEVAPLSPNGVQSDTVITESMVEAEKDMEKVTLEKEAEISRQAQQDVVKLGSGQQDDRYHQLKFLLRRSQAYAQYLSGRIERQKADLKRQKQLIMALGERKTDPSDTTDGIPPDTHVEGGADSGTPTGAESLSPLSHLEGGSVKERKTNGDTNDSDDRNDNSAETSSLSQTCNDTPESDASSDVSYCLSDDDTQTKTSAQPPNDRETRPCTNIDTNISKRRTRSMGTVSSDPLTAAANITTPPRVTRRSSGTISCVSDNVAETKASGGRTRHSGRVSADFSPNTPVTVTTKATISCDTDSGAPTRRQTRQSQQNIACDSRNETPKRRTQRRETISQDSSSATQLDTPDKQTDGTVSCDTVRVTRSGSKVVARDPVGMRAREVTEPALVRPTRKRKADAVTDRLEDAFLRIKREKVGDKETVNCATSADTHDVLVAMETPVAEDMQIATDTPSVKDKQVVKDTVAEDVTSSVVAPDISDGDTSITPVVPPSGGMLHVLGTEDVLSVMNPEAVTVPLKRYIEGELVPLEQPLLVTGGILRDYQIEGYQWLQLLYENGVNGILADEMGLGKTIQCIASIADLVYKGVPGPFLICAPLSTLPNWVSEFRRFAPRVPVILYHGSKEERMILRRQIHHWHEIRHGVKVQPVVITSFEITMNDRVHLNSHLWKYVIVDEGHRIKNSRCRLVRELKLYRSTHKMLLTGTPLQNNLAELWSLLHFLLPELFDTMSSFEEFLDVAAFDDALAREAMVKEEQQKQILSMLHELLSPFILRRLKVDVSVTIPPKREVLVYAPLSRRQAKQYRSILDRSIANLIDKKEDDTPVHYGKHGRPVRRSRKQMSYEEMTDIQVDRGDDVNPFLSEEVNEGSTDKNNAKEQNSEKFCVNVQLRNMMMLLRKCCNHPYLIEYPLTPDGEYLISEALVTSSGKFMLLDRMLTKLKQRGHKVLLFSQMTSILDVVEDYCNLRRFSYHRLDGSTKMEDRRQQIDDFNGSDDTFIFLLSTRAGGLGINLAAADTVIIFDSDWNPQQDLQAQDRCHRIGQSRPVLVFRLVTANTIDQKIVERADAKRKLEKLVLHQGKFKCQNFLTNFKRITPEEVMELLKAATYDKVIEGCGHQSEVISDHDLEKLLDRSDLQRLWEQRMAQYNGEETPAPTESECHNVEGRFKVVTEDKGRIGLES